jgi:serine/threonine-protein kinase
VGFTPIEQVGKGGMGVVWRARDDDTGQIVALKLLRDLYAEDPAYRSRFEHELEIAKRITSPHVVKVLGYGAREGVPYIAFEFVEGPSLRELLAQHGPYGWPDVRAMLLQLAEGLADAHAAGVIHRDVKPSNILIAPGGIAKLADFGISRATDLTRVTKTSGLLGTPVYLAPEGPVDARSDLYSLGVIAFELLTGSPPFEGATYHEVLVAHLRQPPNISKLPPEARPIVAWLLAKDPDSRAQSARQLVRVLTGAEPIPGARPAAASFADGSRRTNSDQTTLVAKGSLTSWPGAVTGAAPRATGNPRLYPSVALAIIGAIAVIAVVGAAVLVATGRPSSTSSATQMPAGVVTEQPSATGEQSVAQAPVTTATSTAMPYEGPTGVWLALGSLPQTVWGQGAAQLSDGRISVFAMVQGPSHEMALGTWLVDPDSGFATGGSSMQSLQAVPGVAVLKDGSVFVAGGWGGSKGNYPVTAAEMLDGSSGTWTQLAPMLMPRSQATVTELSDGSILVAGGWVDYTGSIWTATATAEIYDRGQGSWKFVQSMSTPRALATATRLQDGRVLVAGGSTYYVAASTKTVAEQVVSSAELYDPASDSWEPAGNMSAARAAHCAALLPNGHVLVTGGWSNGTQLGIASTDEYTPNAGWQPGANMPRAHAQARLVTLLDGRLLEIGGVDAKDNTTATTELFDPATGVWQRTGNLTQAVYWPAVVVLRDGRVLVAGGGADTLISGRLQIYAPPPK